MLKVTATDSKLLVASLKAENAKLHKAIARLETKVISLQNRAAALEKEIKSGNNRELVRILDDISNS